MSGHGSEEADRLFLLTTRRLAPPGLAREDVRLALALAKPPPGPVADLGCGYGRHLGELLAQRGAPVWGIDSSPLLLREAAASFPAAQLVLGDLRALPLEAGCLSAAFCFYSSMFLGTEADTQAALASAARALRPRGALVLTTDNPLRMAQSPVASFQEDVPGLGRVTEESRFDPVRFVDEVRRELVCENGEKLSASFHIRYYLPPELAALARAAGLHLHRLEPDAELNPSTPQLIALLRKV